VQNRKCLIYFGSQKTRTEFHNGSFGSVSSVSVLGYFGSVPRFRFFLPRPKGAGRACAKRYPWSGPCDQDRTEGIRPGRGERLRAALLLSVAVRSPELRQA
jgi:hypothetical protein